MLGQIMFGGIDQHSKQAYGCHDKLLGNKSQGDLRELCPEQFSLTRNWQVKQALKTVRGE